MTDCPFCSQPCSEEQAVVANEHGNCTDEYNKRVNENKCIACGINEYTNDDVCETCADENKEFQGYPGP